MPAKGHIPESDLNDKNTLFDRIRGLTKNVEFIFVTDHRELILHAAEKH
jgi:hypothetical protein